MKLIHLIYVYVLVETGFTSTHNIGEPSHHPADGVHALLVDSVLQRSVPSFTSFPRSTGLLHGVAAALPESAVDWMTHPVFRQHPFTLTAVGRLGPLAIFPHSPHDVDAEDDAQNEEHESDDRANDDRHECTCKEGWYLCVTDKLLICVSVLNNHIALHHYLC